MRREAAFRSYLNSLGKGNGYATSYVTYCNKIEFVLGDDMEELIKSPTVDQDVRNDPLLDSHHVSGLNRYREFASAPSPVVIHHTPSKAPKKGYRSEAEVPPTPIKGKDSPCGRVYYDQDVPINERVPGLCEILNDAYIQIRKFAKKLLNGIVFFEEFDSIPVILSDKLPTKTYEETEEKIAERLHDEITRREKLISRKEIEKILKNRYFTVPVLGTFFHKDTDPHVKLYYKNTDKTDWDEYVALMKSVLAHEYLHYLEYQYLIGLKNPFSNIDVSEGLADFFGTLFSISLGGHADLKIAEDRYDAWKKHFGGVWPYANALYFYILDSNEIPYSNSYVYYENSGSIEKFITVFRLLSPIFRTSAMKHMILG